MPNETTTARTRNSTYVENQPVTDLTPYQFNPRVNAAAVAAVICSVKTHKFANPLTSNSKSKDSHIHTKTKSAIKTRGARAYTEIHDNLQAGGLPS